MNRINDGMAIVAGWIFIVVMLPFFPLFYLVGWLDEMMYRRNVMREVRERRIALARDGGASDA